MDILISFKNTFNELIEENKISVIALSRAIDTSPYVILKWKNHNKNLKLSSLIKLADYFNCSIEYLCGKTDTVLDYMPKQCPEFGDWIKVVLHECEISSYKLFKNTCIKNSQFHYWRKGFEPLLTSLEVMSEYLGITLDHLVGRDR